MYMTAGIVIFNVFQGPKKTQNPVVRPKINVSKVDDRRNDF